MAMEKKKLIWIGVVTAFVITGIILYVYRDKIFGKKVEDPNKNNEPVPQGSPTPKWIEEKFDLNVGMYGPMIAKVQKALGIDDDGKFGNQTKTTIQAKGYTVPLKKSDYDKIVYPTPIAGSNFEDVKKALENRSTAITGGIRTAQQAINKSYLFDFYSNSRVIIKSIDGNEVIAKGNYSNGGKKIVLDSAYGGKISDKTAVFLTLADMAKQIEGN